MALSFRSRIEHASAPLAERFAALPRPVAVGALLAVAAVGAFAPAPWGGMAFLLVAFVVAWLFFLTWQRLSLPERLMRAAVLLLLVAVAVVRLVPQ